MNDKQEILLLWLESAKAARSTCQNQEEFDGLIVEQQYRYDYNVHNVGKRTS